MSEASPMPDDSNTRILQKTFSEYRDYIQSQIIGQEQLVEKLLIALLADGHILVEGAPGLAKTRAVKVLSEGLDADFQRIQFTPDLLPADLTGTDVFRPQDGSFHFQPGPLFHNIILADEINRAPAKVQSALLEAMGEGQITAGGETRKLPELFLVMATQNPIEQEGTYPLPEAQLDRFLMHINVDYPDAEAEKRILRLVRDEAAEQTVKRPQAVSQQMVFDARQSVLSLHMAENLEEYIVQLVLASRHPGVVSADLEKMIEWGASPRASIALDRTSRARAWLAKRDYVTPEDIQTVAHDVLRHRILLSYQAEAEGYGVDQIIDKLIAAVPVP